MAKNSTDGLKARVIKMRLDENIGWKQILEIDGVNYGAAWLWVAEEEVRRTPSLAIKNPTPRAIVAARKVGGEHSSWGWLMVRTGLGQASVRKLYEEGTNEHSRGTRVGKGGRFMFDEEGYYAEDRQAGFHYDREIKGRPELPKGVKATARKTTAAKKGAAKKGTARKATAAKKTAAVAKAE